MESNTMIICISMLLLLLLFFETTTQAIVLESGEFVKVKESSALLACPQSLNTLDGFGHCVGMIPLGAARVHGTSSKGRDVFVQCNAQMKPPQGNQFTYRYPFLERDENSHIPVFDAPVRIAPFTTNFSTTILPKFIWETKVTTKTDFKPTVRAAAFTQDYMYILTLDESLNRWVLLRTVPFELPIQLNHTLSLSSVVLVENVNGDNYTYYNDTNNNSISWKLYVTLKTGTSMRSHDIFPYHANWRSPNFHPYGGDGIYNGNIDLIGIASFDINDKGTSSNFQLHTPKAWSGGLMNLNLGLLQHDNDDKIYLLGGSRTGLIYKIQLNNSEHVGNDPRNNAWNLAPAIDASTNTLFRASKIDAKPFGYDNNHIMIACENGLHFIEETTQHYNSIINAINDDDNDNDINDQTQFLNIGEVLQKNAVLVTGQTPTVSTADWDNDGLVDIIAGSSEGRFFFSKQAKLSLIHTNDENKGIFHRPIALHHNDTAASVGNVGTSTFSSEILVQGGYRRDIQGPRENRWGYTAPFAVDWNGDKLIDIISSDNSAQILLYLRYQDSNGDIGLHNGVPLMLDGLEIHTSWRNGPACAHINGKMAIVTSDEEDQVHLYYRLDNYNLIDGGKMVLRDPNTSKLHNIGPVNYLKAGATGRLKYTLCDFNDDGHLDLILGTNGYHAIPSPELNGLPACVNGTLACKDNGATVLVLLQNASATTASAIVFEWPLWLTTKGYRVSYGGQELGVAPVISTDGGGVLEGLILATPGGRHVFWAMKDLGLSSTEPPLR